MNLLYVPMILLYFPTILLLFEHLKCLTLTKVRFVQEILGPHRFRNVRRVISCNFVLLSSALLRGAPRNDGQKTKLKNSLVDNFGRRYLWATDRRCFPFLHVKSMFSLETDSKNSFSRSSCIGSDPGILTNPPTLDDKTGKTHMFKKCSEFEFPSFTPLDVRFAQF